MAFSVTNDFTAGTTITAADVNQNFTDIENKINGNITEEDLSSNSQIATTQLANPYHEIIINLTIPAAAMAVPPADNDIIAASGLPGLDGYSYSVTDITWCGVDVGTANATFDLVWLSDDDDGTTTTVTSIATAKAIEAGDGATYFNSGAWTPGNNTIQQSQSSQRFIALVAGATTFANAGTAADAFFTVTLRIIASHRSS